MSKLSLPFALVVTAAGLGTAAPVVAQGGGLGFSDSYTFLKAVRDRDGGKVTELLERPSTTIVDTRTQGSGEAALHIVVRRRDTPWIGFLLSRGANPNIRDERGDTPLLLAAGMGYADGADALLRRRAGVDITNNAGETPLIRAVQNRDVEMVRLLLASGADPARSDSVAGMSARDYAERDGRSEAILRLLDTPRERAAPARPVAGPGL